MRKRTTVAAAALFAAGAMLGWLTFPTVGQEKKPDLGPKAESPFTTAQLEERTLHRRAVEAVIWGMPAVNAELMLQEMLAKTRGKENQILYWGRPLDWHNQTLTPNPDSIYFMSFINTKDVGPLVLDVPPAGDDGSFNVNMIDSWQLPLADAGLYGTDKGKGGKYLFLPPGYSGAIPQGYISLKLDTFCGVVLLRSNLKSHSSEDVAKSVAYGKRAKIYPLSQADNPQATKFTDAQDVLFDSTIKYDFSFFENLNRVVQREPWLQRDRAMIDQLRSIGIEKGKPFNPDATTKSALEAGMREAHALLRARYEKFFPPLAPYWEGSQWAAIVGPAIVNMWRTGLNDPNAYPVDDRGVAYTYGFIAIKNLGVGQFYLLTIHDHDGKPLDGNKTYRLRVPPGVPAEQYWSATAYDGVTHALIRNMSRASRSSQIPEMKKNADGSIDVYFGPAAPVGQESNWVPTDSKREFEVIFRLYAPTKALYDKTWKLPDIEKVK